VMKRGYSITRVNGKAIKSYSEVRPQDVMDTILADGSIISEVKSVNEKEKS
jgi:exodeoxyribonuclease VII large subunit